MISFFRVELDKLRASYNEALDEYKQEKAPFLILAGYAPDPRILQEAFEQNPPYPNLVRYLTYRQCLEVFMLYVPPGNIDPYYMISREAQIAFSSYLEGSIKVASDLHNSFRIGDDRRRYSRVKLDTLLQVEVAWGAYSA